MNESSEIINTPLLAVKNFLAELLFFFVGSALRGVRRAPPLPFAAETISGRQMKQARLPLHGWISCQKDQPF